jgi:hypothetical protein
MASITHENEIILYQPDNAVKLEVRLENETVWLTQAQMVELFNSSKANISEHIKNIYSTQELYEDSTVRDFRTVRMEGHREVVRQMDYYNLDMIIAVGYRVNTKQGTQFRQWATRVLKDYLLKGYAVNQRFERIEQNASETSRRLTKVEEKIDFFVKTALPPIEGIFYEGQIFDAYTFAADLVKSAKKSIVLIDNYIDESVLILLSKRNAGVDVAIYTAQISQALQLDIKKHNLQYPQIVVKTFKKSHDRFLIIDDTVYHIGASLKDLGKKWFAFSKMVLNASELLQRIK